MIALVDYDAGNVKSVEKAIEKTVTNWIGQALLPDDITVMNVRF